MITTDNAGNTFTSTTITNVRVDNTVPTQNLTLTGVSPVGSAYLSGTNLFYRGAPAGQLRIRNTVADGGSGPASSTTSALGGTSAGWTHTAGTVSTPAGGPYDSNLFSWSAGTTSSPPSTSMQRTQPGTTRRRRRSHCATTRPRRRAAR